MKRRLALVLALVLVVTGIVVIIVGMHHGAPPVDYTHGGRDVIA